MPEQDETQTVTKIGLSKSVDLCGLAVIGQLRGFILMLEVLAAWRSRPIRDFFCYPGVKHSRPWRKGNWWYIQRDVATTTKGLDINSGVRDTKKCTK